MRQYERQSSRDLEREATAQRAEVAATLREIQERLSPGRLLDAALRTDEARAGVSRFATAMVNNPIPVLLIGVGLLWLAFSNNRPQRVMDYRGARGRATMMPMEGGSVMAVSRENLTAWLRDAHAMEHQAIEILERQADRLEHYPELRAKVRTHLEETHRQAERVERCLHQLGTDTSSLKTGAGKVIGAAQQLSGLFASDEVLKSGIADYAFEHYEIASYKMLIAAADEAGEHEVQRSLEENLREEEAMAEWLGHHLPEVTRQYLHREAAGQSAKV
jgi:ferritin-like metal-binding protein YciE